MPSIKEVIEKLAAENRDLEERKKRNEEAAAVEKERIKQLTIEGCLNLLRTSEAKEILEDLNQTVLEGQGEILQGSGTRELISYDDYSTYSTQVCFAHLLILWPRGKEQRIVVEAVAHPGYSPRLYVAQHVQEALHDSREEFVEIENNKKIKESTRQAVANVFLRLPH
ncbi:MAG: hypothetical protein AAB875_03735 [Patescibacteria group bacterium]